MIVFDPRPDADGTRGTICDALVESIDLAVPGNGVGEIDAEAGDILQGRSQLAAVEPARAPRAQGPLLFPLAGTPVRRAKTATKEKTPA